MTEQPPVHFVRFKQTDSHQQTSGQTSCGIHWHADTLIDLTDEMDRVTCPGCLHEWHNAHSTIIHTEDDIPEYAIPGYRNMLFRGGELDGHRRLIKLPVHIGHRYNRMVPVNETWVYDGDSDMFTLAHVQ